MTVFDTCLPQARVERLNRDGDTSLFWQKVAKLMGLQGSAPAEPYGSDERRGCTRTLHHFFAFGHHVSMKVFILCQPFLELLACHPERSEGPLLDDSRVSVRRC